MNVSHFESYEQLEERKFLGNNKTHEVMVRVVFIPKANRIGHCIAKDYRPFSRLLFMVKTIEMLVDFDKRDNLDSNILSKSQHAYCKGNSKETTLHTVIAYLENSLDRKEVL